jgi:hypothetical protein
MSFGLEVYSPTGVLEFTSEGVSATLLAVLYVPKSTTSGTQHYNGYPGKTLYIQQVSGGWRENNGQVNTMTLSAFTVATDPATGNHSVSWTSQWAGSWWYEDSIIYVYIK